MINILYDRSTRSVNLPRVRPSKRDIQHLFEIEGTNSAAKLAKRSGLPYNLVYNVTRCRVKSISEWNYEKLFGSPAPRQQQMKIDGDAFRKMAALWLYVNDHLTRADLYRELHELPEGHRVDHRIFSGKVRDVDAWLETKMRAKFADAGIEEQDLDLWLAEFEKDRREDMIPYDRIRPLLRFLDEHLGIPPGKMLNRSIAAYESGILKRVHRKVYDRASVLKQKGERALGLAREDTGEVVKESMIGGKPGYTLYSQVSEELQFLKRYAGKSTKKYLGRSSWTYETGNSKRIADWRARRVLRDCGRFIRSNPTLPLSQLPRSQKRIWIRWLTGTLTSRASNLLNDPKAVEMEKRVLQPLRPKNEYHQDYNKFIPFDRAPRVLGMKRKAFDLMVAENCELFRIVGKYTQRWYLSDRYLREISQKEHFYLISKKYELMARKLDQSMPVHNCVN